MSAKTQLVFLMNDEWTRDYFSLYYWYILDPDHNSVTFHDCNDETGKLYHQLPEVDVSHVYLHCDLSRSEMDLYVKW
jgi:hypothetical protein